MVTRLSVIADYSLSLQISPVLCIFSENNSERKKIQNICIFFEQSTDRNIEQELIISNNNFSSGFYVFIRISTTVEARNIIA